MNNPSPRLLIMRLLTVADNHTLNISEAILAGRVFGITENSIRVTMARLVQSDGSWIAVATGGLPRSDRKILRARDRALSLLGFRQLDKGLYIRPNNLHGGINGVRKRLLNLGLGKDAIIFKAGDFDALRQEKALALWSDMQLVTHYKEMSAQLNEWLANKDNLSADTALREVFMLGDAAIRSVIFDPLLPAPLVDEAARQQCFDTVRRFNDEGRRLWLAFFAANTVKVD